MKMWIKGLIAAGSLALSQPAFAADSALNGLVQTLTRATPWQQTAAVTLQFPTFHPQGMLKIGDAFYVSSVDIRKPTTRYPALQDGYDRDTGEGVGHLFKFDAQGKLLADITLGEGSIYHPGGIDFDGKDIWVPVAEYRPNSQSIIYKVDPQTMKATEVFRYKDHIGGIVHNTDAKSLHGVSWGSRRFYAWPLDAAGKVTNAATPPEQLRVINPALYIDYQDCHFIGTSRMLCSGLNNYRASKDGPIFRLGGFEIVDLKDNRPVFQVPIELWSPSGLPMTQNPFWVEPTGQGVRAYFMPDDDNSTLFTYEAVTK
ncbi:DUF6454 family protein [Bosea lathyri]|uniref:Uncharacterized protein n=1 Tax=Bosea lathyri TaxID=1036778 RepID=A0A1H6DDW2_9HYPH|nr:DUF6454 family protein [Bosea lathyri]SEG82925.1 hypothetical protein SAMN04488115_12131 [Bosea lathyri]